MSLNRRILLAERPEGAVSERTFRLEAAALPALAEGELLVKNLCLSIDPTIRGWIERDPVRWIRGDPRRGSITPGSALIPRRDALFCVKAAPRRVQQIGPDRREACTRSP